MKSLPLKNPYTRLYSSLIPLEKLQVKQTLLVQVIVEIKKLHYLPINGQTTVKATDSCL